MTAEQEILSVRKNEKKKKKKKKNWLVIISAHETFFSRQSMYEFKNCHLLFPL